MSRTMRSRFLALSLGLALALPGLSMPANAEGETAAESSKSAEKETVAEQVAEVWNRDPFTGDWEGWRTDLQEHGIDPHFRLSQ